MLCTTGKNGSRDVVTNVNQKQTDVQTDGQKDGPPEWSEKLTQAFNYMTG